MQEALKRTDRFMSDELAWKRYLDTEIARLDYNSRIEGALEKGIEQGKKETQDSVIPSLLKNGFPPKDLSESFALPLEKIFEIARKNGIDLSFGH